ncbi:cryptochrome/photolyase family protein [Luteibacter sp. UNCMF366Tsu5.1]|uniref:cryptochrome/photolyase family protein n=1 Tax=Luteibacter sp. UNCMF366Tsu5.1 TaxID=1502758 RepID=UPI0009088027|nr:deoxyribodipyrimidine photo-lyase [Luteibacter sp. UNCMF366Tsu5.1]SFW21908.1 deoxyribodipyrimidine photo-lyase [Luteibacter sp. UNCMF366Tsu5.1]
MSTAIVWFRRDLRLADNPALEAAVRAHDRVIAAYVHAPEEEGAWTPGAASRWWLHHSLMALEASLVKHGGHLHVVAGPTLASLRDLIGASGATAVYFNRLYEPRIVRRDKVVRRALEQDGVAVASFNAALWCEPWDVETKQGGPYKVFTPFWRHLRTRIDGAEPLPVPSRLSFADVGAGGASDAIDDLSLLPTRDWARGFSIWHPGEAGAWEMLSLFADDALAHYAESRDLPARHGTSRLSPHLHWGEISPVQVAAYLREQAARQRNAADIEPYLRQLGWREFGHHLLYHFPKTPTESFNPAFNGFQWAERDAHALRRWKQGRTGIPIVDAGMRELWATGWMHNRVRMLVASLLTKNLRQHWVLGEKWFWDTLVDADLANNAMGWQWVAGSGADAAPYFRIFNPVTQSEKFDPEGAYIRRWVPELADAPGRLVHAPWEDETFLARSGYPRPMVDLKTSREAALGAYQALREKRDAARN